MKLESKEIKTKTGKICVLRTPDSGDAGAMLTFLRELFHESSDNLNGPPERFDKTNVEEEEKVMRDWEKSGKDFFLSAFCDDQVVGNLTFKAMTGPAEEHCGMLGIGVLKSHQGQGVGKALMKYCISTAKQAGIWNIRFNARTHNKAGIALYESLGFTRVGTILKASKVRNSFQDEYLYQKLLD